MAEAPIGRRTAKDLESREPRRGAEDATPGLLLSAPISHPELDEPEMRPPPFLTKLEAMADIYGRTHDLVSRKTTVLLGSADLDDLLRLLDVLHASEKLMGRAEAHLDRRVLKPLGADLGPMLSGFTDARLWEPWRLFLLGWDIWQPKGWADGVELFWEGEAEDDEGRVLEIVQSLSGRHGELALSVRVGTDEDVITFDGEAFYRLPRAG